MKAFYWLIIIMDITLMFLLWLYIYDLYIQDRLDLADYPSHIFQSDQAIPILGLGVILNTGAIIYFIADTHRRRREEEKDMMTAKNPRYLENVADQNEIKELEDELEQIVERMEELRKIHAQKKKDVL
ncbi:MAG: hypothetical protein V1789_07995 [PVC group bacterium]